MAKGTFLVRRLRTWLLSVVGGEVRLEKRDGRGQRRE